MTSIRVEGTAGTTTVTGEAFRSALGLRSNWFADSGAPLTTVSGAATAAAVARRIPAG